MFWDNVAGVYDVFVNVINRKTHRKLKKIVSDLIGPEDTVLECACGTGLLSAVIAPKCRRLTATDYSEKMLKKAEKNCAAFQNIAFARADVTALAFPDGSFDAVLDFCILHHVEGWRTFFDECRRVLRDGGSVYAADLSKRCIHIVDALLRWGHAEEALFTLREFEAEANRRGFATVHKTSDLGLEGYFRFRKEKNK